MRLAWRLIASVLFCIGLASWTVSASQAELGEAGLKASSLSTGAISGSPVEPRTETTASRVLVNGLVVPEVQMLDGDQQVLAAEQAQRATEALVRRDGSRTVYEHLSGAAAMRLAQRMFPALIEVPVGGPPHLEPGQAVTGFLSDDAAQLNLGAGRHGVIESTVPIAVEVARGKRAPVDLTLTEREGGFQALTPAVGVRIPKRLANGVSLSGTGVSLTPVDAQGAALSGSPGALDGSTVLYAN